MHISYIKKLLYIKSIFVDVSSVKNNQKISEKKIESIINTLDIPGDKLSEKNRKVAR